MNTYIIVKTDGSIAGDELRSSRSSRRAAAGGKEEEGRSILARAARASRWQQQRVPFRQHNNATNLPPRFATASACSADTQQSRLIRRWQRHQVQESAGLRCCEKLEGVIKTAPTPQEPEGERPMSSASGGWSGVWGKDARCARARLDATTIPRYVSLPCTLGHLWALAASCDSFEKVGLVPY